MPRTWASSSSASKRAFSMPRSARSCAAFWDSGRACSIIAFRVRLRVQELGLARELQRFEQLIQIAIEDFLQIVRGKADAVVGYAALRKIVRANLAGTVARADL